MKNPVLLAQEKVTHNILCCVSLSDIYYDQALENANDLVR